jgi:hypothetical protein
MTVPPATMQYDIPFVVSVVFYDGKDFNHVVQFISAPNEVTAAARTVSQYHQNGGKLPLMVIHAVAVARDVAQAALQVYEAKDEAERKEQEKVKPFTLINKNEVNVLGQEGPLKPPPEELPPAGD